jgi:uncharacterized protein
VASLTGQGGWPLTAFLTPDGKPFYGGTYFPPADAYGRPSFKRVLLSIAAAYREKQGDVMEQARMVESAIARAESLSAAGGTVSASVIDAIVESARSMFDEVNGGFGSAPKFPHPAALDLVMDRYVRAKELVRSPLDGAEPRHTDDKQGRAANDIRAHAGEDGAGGVYDQLAGGFHRYSVDERWIVPHFEKMCYDNSELLKNYVHAYQATGMSSLPRWRATLFAGWMNGSATAPTAASTLRRTPTTRWTTMATTSPGLWRKLRQR